MFYVSQGNLPKVGEAPAPIISTNLAKHQRVESSWSYDSLIMDFANDDDFNTSWVSNPEVKNPWIYVTLGKEQAINMVTITEGNSPAYPRIPIGLSHQRRMETAIGRESDRTC